MKKLFLMILPILTILLLHSAAFAVVDPEPDHMSIYFDQEADVSSLVTPPYLSVPCHVILTNPTCSSLYGYEFGVVVAGNVMVTSVVYNGAGIPEYEPCPLSDIHQERTFFTVTEATTLATVYLFLLDTLPVELMLKAADTCSVEPNLPAVLLSGGEFLPIRPSAWDDENDLPLVCATINSTGVATDEATWAGVKSLYR